MTGPVGAGRHTRRSPVAGLEARETFEALVFDWDGTAVPDRHFDASAVRERLEELCAAGVHVFVVSGTHVENVDGQLRARPTGRGTLHMCLNRGSEVFEVSEKGPAIVQRREATVEEDRSLDIAAERTIELLRARGMHVELVSNRLNRRKIDLIPDPAWSDPPKARIGELADAVSARLASFGVEGLAQVVSLATSCAHSAGLADPRITSDVKHVEIGLTDKSDSARFAAAWLRERGITGSLVLLAGDEFGSVGEVPGSDSLMVVEELARAKVVSVGVEPEGVPQGVDHFGGGPPRFLELLDAQLRRREEKRVPQIDEDPAWVLPLTNVASRQRAAEALATLETLGNGWAGTRGSREEGGSSSFPLFVVGGVYHGGGAGLLPGPLWTGLELRRSHHSQSDDHRLLDLRTATLVRTGRSESAVRSMRFVSGASPFALALRAEGPVSRLEPGEALREPSDTKGFEQKRVGDTFLARSGSEHEGGIVVAAHDHEQDIGEHRVIERLCAWVGHPTQRPTFEEALEKLAQVEVSGFDSLLAEHREAWARRWADAEVVIEGSPEDELAARFNVFHLLSTAADADEAAVGARGLSGSAYGGHVFWDADVFVLPALAALHPSAARAMLEYRIRRLQAAREAAESRGLRGARFPWESAGDGKDVTPHFVRDAQGGVMPIRTGQDEEHITADVAWAATQYAQWTGDGSFLEVDGRDLVVETARYWASRVRLDADGHGHIYGVIGPDEYHEPVDDNSFTNVMARWNLRRGAGLLADTESAEADRWRSIADSLVDGWRQARGIYEQFAGYFDLEPLLVSDVAPSRPVAIDVLLGADRVAGSQLIKQADVLMLHHLLPTEVEPGSLESCLSFYEPRTAHGSSLSPAVHASLFARARQPEKALGLFRLAARMDLDDLTGTTAGGLHLAAMGGTWQALAFGFLGLHAEGAVLEVDPCLPRSWQALSLRFRFRAGRVGIRAEHDSVTVDCETPLEVKVAGRSAELCDPPGRRFSIEQVRSASLGDHRDDLHEGDRERRNR